MIRRPKPNLRDALKGGGRSILRGTGLSFTQNMRQMKAAMYERLERDERLRQQMHGASPSRLNFAAIAEQRFRETRGGRITQSKSDGITVKGPPRDNTRVVVWVGGAV
jgi:hypothetical protein